MQKRPIGYQPGKPSILDKRIPKNHKYDHVQSKLVGKIGTTVNDIEYLSTKQISKKKGELFYRIKPSTLWKMMNHQIKTQSIYNINDDSRSQNSNSNLTSITIKTEQLPIGIQTDFILLDFRQRSQYEQYHIRQSINYDGIMIKQDKTLGILYQYRNKDNKIIIVYHNDEKKGIQFTKQMYEKGYDNLYLLSGGIQAFGAQFTQGIEGKNIPMFQVKDDGKKFKKKRIQ